MNVKNNSKKRLLAIDGGSPAFDIPLHVGRPNVGDREKFHLYVDQIFDNLWLTNDGPLVRELEKRIAELHQVKHCVAICNATIALEIAIRALGLKGEVIVPSYTFIATAHALQWQEITPVFADINPDTHSLDPIAVEKMITPNTTGIIGVHLWGKIAQVEALSSLSKKYELKLMFDAAHAFACAHNGQMVGNFGECEVMSMHATKMMNSFEGGVILTNNTELAEKAKLMRNFGFSGLDNVIYPGTNGKMTEISAAMGLVNMDELNHIIIHNRINYKKYESLLANVDGVRLLPYDDEKNNYHYIIIELQPGANITRDQLVAALHAENILARRYFWPGCHKMKPYRDIYPHAGLLLPNTETVSERVVVLPTGLTINHEHIELIVNVIDAIISRGSHGLAYKKAN